MNFLKVGIDGRSFTSPAGGVRRYVTGLTAGLRSLPDAVSLVALGGDPAHIPEGIPHVAESLHPPTNLGWMVVGLPHAASRAGVDIIHAPAYTAPFWSTAPVVLTIHDVSYERHPEWFPYRRDRFRRAFYRRSALSAAQVITDSTFSAEEIAAAYGLGGDRLTVVPLAVDTGFAAAAADEASHLPAGISQPFVLHVGDLHERRNLAVVIDALSAMRRTAGMTPVPSLALAGIDRGVGHALMQRAAAAGATGLVGCLGAVPERQLLALYRSATALVYPSLYEGFGFPVLEAMAVGTPVIASRAASIPEVLGDAGMLLDPQDVAAWATAITRVMTDEAGRQRMIAAGRARAATFTWERTARATLDVYERALHFHRGRIRIRPRSGTGQR